MEHIYFTIPGFFNFHDIYDRAVHMAQDGAHFVEVGSWRGRSAAYMGVAIANSGKDIRLDCVDTFEGDLYEEFLENIKPVRRGTEIYVHRGRSTDVASLYPEDSLDFIFLDADHTAEAVRDDVLAWRPKLKHNGILAGDDLNWNSVRAGLKMAGVKEVLSSHSAYPGWVIPANEMSRAYWMRGAETDSPEARKQVAVA